MAKKTREYEADLIEQLKDAEVAVEYLNASLEDSDDGSDERFLMALRQVAKADGMTGISEKSGAARQAMYRALSECGAPELSFLKAVLSAMAMRLAVGQKPKAS